MFTSLLFIMIVECIIFFATLHDPLASDIQKVQECSNYIPSKIIEYAKPIHNNFNEENIERAVKVSWCESRGKTTALNTGNNDSGLFQVIPNTWNWVAEEYNLPKFDSLILTYNNIPVEQLSMPTRMFLITKRPDLYKLQKVQFIPYYNILVSKILVEDIHSNSTYWRPWNASADCWNSHNWYLKWKLEE